MRNDGKDMFVGEVRGRGRGWIDGDERRRVQIVVCDLRECGILQCSQSLKLDQEQWSQRT